MIGRIIADISADVQPCLDGGRGNYFLRDHDDGTVPFMNASEWRKLQIVNRNDPAYRPPQ